MARIAGINIPVNKQVAIALTHIYGVGRNLACLACQVAEVDPAAQVKDLSEPEVAKLRDVVANPGDLLGKDGEHSVSGL